MELVKENHIEVSDGDTQLISSVLCRLHSPIHKNQLFENNYGKKVIMCKIEGQKMEDGTYHGFTCPYFFGAVYPFKDKFVDCRNENCIINKKQ